MESSLSNYNKIQLEAVEEVSNPFGLFGAWSDEQLEVGDVVFKIQVDAMHRDYHFALTSLADMKQELQEFDVQDYKNSGVSHLSPSGYLRYVSGDVSATYITQSFDSTCAVCEEDIPKDSEEGMLTLQSWVGIHVGCIGELIEILDDIWEHNSDKILAEKFS